MAICVHLGMIAGTARSEEFAPPRFKVGRVEAGVLADRGGLGHEQLSEP
jgi:hypothetical protein